MANITDINPAPISNAFPTRQYRRLGSKTNSGGAWLIAYKAEQRSRFKAIVCAEKADTKEQDARLSNATSDSSVTFETRSDTFETRSDTKITPEIKSKLPKILDGFFLLKHCCVDDPSDLCTVNICGCGLTEVNSEDLALFDNVVHVDAAENNLPMDELKTFPDLKELQMQLNELSNITINIGDFTNLQALDLSYNCLKQQDISNLGLLPQLNLLKLTANDLTNLPIEMSADWLPENLNENEKEIKPKRVTRFPSLECLFLDNNRLTEASLLTLSGIKRLKYLNMENNEINCMPTVSLLLKMKDNIRSRINSGKPHTTPPASASSERSSIVEDKKSNHEIDINSRKSSQTTVDHHETTRTRTAESILGSSIMSNSQLEDEFCFPFYNLCFMNLANNAIKTEEALLSLVEYPQIQELIIYGNPLLTKMKGSIPLLTKELVLARGIHIVKSDKEEEFNFKQSRPRPIINKHRKILEVLPPIPKRRYPLSIEAPYYSFATKDAASSSGLAPVVSEKDSTVEVMEERSEVVDNEESRSSFFLTQTDEVGNSISASSKKSITKAYESDNEEEEPPVNPTNTSPSMELVEPLSSKYKGFEEIATNIEHDGMDIVPTDMQSSVRALKYALHHPLIYQKRELSQPENYFKPKLKLGYITARPTNAADKLQSALDVIQSDLNVMEGNLDTLLRKSDEEKQDAIKLLSRVQSKYEEFREATLKSVASTCEVLNEELDNIADAGTEVTNLSPSVSPDLYIKSLRQSAKSRSSSSTSRVSQFITIPYRQPNE